MLCSYASYSDQLCQCLNRIQDNTRSTLFRIDKPALRTSHTVAPKFAIFNSPQPNHQHSLALTMADADEDVPNLGAQDGVENDPTEEAQDFRFLDKLMFASPPFLVAYAY